MRNPYIHKKTGVWCAMSRRWSVGPTVSETTVDREVYQDITAEFMSVVAQGERHLLASASWRHVLFCSLNDGFLPNVFRHWSDFWTFVASSSPQITRLVSYWFLCLGPPTTTDVPADRAHALEEVKANIETQINQITYSCCATYRVCRHHEEDSSLLGVGISRFEHLL